MFRNFFCLTLICSAIVHLSEGMYSCTTPTINGKDWVMGVDKKECVSVIKVQCSGLAVSTTQWKRGTHVQSNCSKIPKNTAIATFAGPGNCYGCSGTPYQHAAIFESCQSDGINVIDQWNSQPTHRRLIRYTGTGSNGGSNFYTIEK